MTINKIDGFTLFVNRGLATVKYLCLFGEATALFSLDIFSGVLIFCASVCFIEAKYKNDETTKSKIKKQSEKQLRKKLNWKKTVAVFKLVAFNIICLIIPSECPTH